MIRNLEMRILVGATNKTAVVSTKFWWLARYVLLVPLFLLNTFQVIQCPNFSIKQGGVKMDNWARARPKIKFLKNMLKIFYRWPLTYATMAQS